METTQLDASRTAAGPASVPLAVDATDLRKGFGSVRAVDGVTLKVEPGEIVAFLGPNGAGKTTTIDMLLGLSQPDSGRRAGLRRVAACGDRPRPRLGGAADRRPPEGHHRPRDARPHREPVRRHPPGRRGDGARRHQPRSPSRRVGAVLRRPAAATAVRDGAAVRPGPADPRRADDRDGRRGPPFVLDRDPRRRGTRPHGAVRHPLPRRGRRVRRPHRADDAAGASSPTAPPPRSRTSCRAASYTPRSRVPTPSRSPPSRASTSVEHEGRPHRHPHDGLGCRRPASAHHDRRPRRRDHRAEPRERVRRAHVGHGIRPHRQGVRS